jgi:hypothetical protein
MVFDLNSAINNPWPVQCGVKFTGHIWYNPEQLKGEITESLFLLHMKL